MPPALSAPATVSDLHAALDAGLPFAATYPASGLRLSNHLPMVLNALHRLQASAAALMATVARQSPRLERLAPDAEESQLARHFAEDVARSGLPQALALHLPPLLAACETAAFHGLIRLAHALDGGHAAAIAQAIGAWQAQFDPLGPLPDGGGHVGDLRLLVDALSDDPSLVFSPTAGTLISDDMRVCSALPGFAAAASAPADAALGLDALAEASLAVYLASRDFTALHLVTACHALHQVLPHARLSAESQRRVLRGVWRAWLAAWCSIGCPRPDWAAVHRGQASERDWDAAREAVIASANDHRIKLAAAALDEWRHRGWPGYAQVLPTAAAEQAA